MGEAIVGAVIGAFLGSVFGYMFSYRLAQQTRQLDLEDRRKRLMRALALEIARDMPPTLGYGLSDREQITIWSGVHLATLDPLIELVADIPDEGLLRALTALHSEINSWNDMVIAANDLQIQVAGHESLPEPVMKNLFAAMEHVASTYALARQAADTAIEALQVRV